VGQFLDYIFIDRNNTIRTRNNYLSWLKTFSKYLLDRGYVPSDPTAGLTTVHRKGELKNRDVIPDDLLKDLHDWLQKNNKHYLLACYILHYCLVRPREMSFLKVGDFSVRKQTLYLHGDNTKNHNDAVITVPQQVLKLMKELKVFDSPSHYYLFSDGFAPGEERRSEKAFRDYWNRYIRKSLRMTDRYKFYSLKDTGITNMLRANTDILTVRDQARHSSILITDIYTPKDIKAANEMLLNYRGVL
jgi:integrase